VSPLLDAVNLFTRLERLSVAVNHPGHQGVETRQIGWDWPLKPGLELSLNASAGAAASMEQNGIGVSMRALQKGFTLLELMLVLAIIGIVLKVGLPAYRDYTIRAKVSELVLSVSGFKTAIEEKARAEGSLAKAGEGLGIDADSGMLSKASTISSAGVITIVGVESKVGAPVTITLSPARDSADGKITWTCSAPAAQHKYVPVECRNTPPATSG
jgi:type IV pilus assembly protein PilA